MEMKVFQTLVTRWIARAFGDEASTDKRERTHRFLEEALELAQAAGATPHEAHALVEYVYSRPAGKADQEVGGVLLTLAGFCSAYGFDMHRCAAAELSRVNRPEVLAKCRAKQDAKKTNPLASPLPGHPATQETAAWIGEHRPHIAEGFDFVRNPIEHPDGNWVKLMCSCGASHVTTEAPPL